MQKLEPSNDAIDSCIRQYIQWRCKNFYNQNKLQGIATPTRNIGDKAPRVCSLDAFESEPIAALADEDDGTAESKIQGFLNYLDIQDVRDYATLAFAGAKAPEIQEKLGLTARQRDYLQQKFRYWSNKYFNIRGKGNERDRSDEERLKKIKPKQSKTDEPKSPRRRISPWLLEQKQDQAGIEGKVLRFYLGKPPEKKRQWRSPLFETDLSMWGK